MALDPKRPTESARGSDAPATDSPSASTRRPGRTSGSPLLNTAALPSMEQSLDQFIARAHEQPPDNAARVSSQADRAAAGQSESPRIDLARAEARAARAEARAAQAEARAAQAETRPRAGWGRIAVAFASGGAAAIVIGSLVRTRDVPSKPPAALTPTTQPAASVSQHSDAPTIAPAREPAAVDPPAPQAPSQPAAGAARAKATGSETEPPAHGDHTHGHTGVAKAGNGSGGFAGSAATRSGSGTNPSKGSGFYDPF